MSVYKAIICVAAELAKEGIGKNRKNDQQGYKFRGIDDVYNELAPLLSKHALCILPRILSRDCVERTTAKGGAIFYVTVEAEFDFVSADDGSVHTVKTFGEAMDSADKATNKAMSAAYKYAAFQAFCIPTEGDNDADATTHEIKPKAAPAPPSKTLCAPQNTDLVEAQTHLLEELMEFCQGQEAVMEENLKLASYYKKADGKEGWLKLSDLTKPHSHEGMVKWIGSTLGKFRKMRDAGELIPF